MSTDLHVIWSRELDRIDAEMERAVEHDDDTVLDALSLVARHLRDQIANTPASSPAAIAAQASLVLRAHEEGMSPGKIELRALRRAISALERMGTT
jgi:hypothetical protein